MRRIMGWTGRLGVASALLFGGAATGGAQTPELNIVPYGRAVEGDSGTLLVGIQVQTSLASLSSVVSVNWRTLAGSATGGGDYVVVSSGILTWPLGDGTPKVLNVQVQGDVNPEWSTTLQQDEVFFVELFNPVNATIGNGRSAVTVVDNDTVEPGVQYLSAVTDSTGTGVTDGRNRLQWRVAPAPTAPTQIKVCWKSNPTSCTSPVSDTDTAGGGCTVVTPAAMGSKQLFTHDNLSAIKVNVPAAYCYSVFTVYLGFSAERAEVAVTTFDSTPGPVKWAFTPGHYSTNGAATLVPPTIGQDGVYSVGTDGVVHAMQRGTGPTSGLWLPGWDPVAVGKPTQNRSAIVPTGGRWRLLMGTDGGGVHAVDGLSGSVVWSRSSAFGSALLSLGGAQAQPAALLKAYGGNNDMVLVGSNNGGSNAFYALNLATGANLVSLFTHAQMGGVLGMAVVSYPSRAFFLTNASSATVYGLDLGPTGSPALTLASLSGPNPHAFAGSNGSAVLRNNKLIFPDSGGGQVFALDVTTGATYNNPTGDGVAKGFVWPDRRDDRLYFSGDTKVQGWRDLGSTFLPIWSTPVMTSPSIVLQKPGSDYLYVGDGLGNLVQIDVNNPSSPLPLPLPGGGQIGAPSLDGANNLVLVGSSTGTIYAVRVPF